MFFSWNFNYFIESKNRSMKAKDRICTIHISDILSQAQDFRKIIRFSNFSIAMVRSTDRWIFWKKKIANAIPAKSRNTLMHMNFWLDIDDLCMRFVEIHRTYIRMLECIWLLKSSFPSEKINMSFIKHYFSYKICINRIFTVFFVQFIKICLRCVLKVSTSRDFLGCQNKIKLYL